MKTIHIYPDKSRHRTERFLLLSGLWIKKEKVASAEREIKSLPAKNLSLSDQLNLIFGSLNQKTICKKTVKDWSSGLWVNAPYDISRRIRNPVTPILVYQFNKSYQVILN